MTDEPKAFMPLYPGDYLRDTGHLTTEEHGAYFLLLIQMWVRGGSLRADPARLANMARIPIDQWDEVWAAIGEFFEEENGRITNPRLTEELERARGLRKARRERARKAAEARWEKERKERAERSDDAPSNAPSMPEAVPGDAIHLHLHIHLQRHRTVATDRRARLRARPTPRMCGASSST